MTRYSLVCPVLLYGVVALAALFPASAQNSDGVALFHKMQRALGGEDKIAAVHDFEEQIHGNMFDAKGKPLGEADKRIRWIRPNYLRLDQIGPFNTYALYFDGTSGWEILPDKSFKPLVGSELKFAQDYLRNFDLNVYLRDRDPRYRITSPETNVVHIERIDDPSDSEDFFLDPISGLPLHDGSLAPPDATHSHTSGMRFEAWTTEHGVKFASQRADFHDGARLAEIISNFITVNGGLQAADLALKPDDLRPVLRKVSK
jgi:hypothetical protein